MKLGISISGGGVKKDQYSYIGIFIGFLDRIIDIILRAVGFFKNNTPYTPAAEEAESTTVAEGE